MTEYELIRPMKLWAYGQYLSVVATQSYERDSVEESSLLTVTTVPVGTCMNYQQAAVGSRTIVGIHVFLIFLCFKALGEGELFAYVQNVVHNNKGPSYSTKTVLILEVNASEYMKHGNTRSVLVV